METITELAFNHTPPKHPMSVYDHPTMAEYYGNLTPFVVLSIFVAALLFILNISIYHTTLIQLRERLNRPLLHITIGLCSPYPVIAFVAILTILVPKAWLICHTVMHLSFTICAILFHRLCIVYVDSELNFIKETDGNAITINTPPCCCCCLCLPALIPTKTKFFAIKCLVWQMPFVQGAIMLALNGIYYTEKDLYDATMKYFMPFIICSILFGLWGLNITVRMVNSVHAEYAMMRKMFCLQLILLLCKLQYLIMNSQLDSVVMGGPYPINHTIYKQAFINLLILAEMVLVSLLVQNAYKTPVQIVQK